MKGLHRISSLTQVYHSANRLKNNVLSCDLVLNYSGQPMAPATMEGDAGLSMFISLLYSMNDQETFRELGISPKMSCLLYCPMTQQVSGRGMVSTKLDCYCQPWSFSAKSWAESLRSNRIRLLEIKWRYFIDKIILTLWLFDKDTRNFQQMDWRLQVSTDALLSLDNQHTVTLILLDCSYDIQLTKYSVLLLMLPSSYRESCTH